MRTRYLVTGMMLVACGDGGTGPDTGDLVPTVLAVTPQGPPGPTESAVVIRLEVRTGTGEPYPDAIVTWDATHGEVLSPALTDEEGRLEALWSFNLAVDPSGTRAELRACARREVGQPCGYSDPVSLDIP